MLVTFARACSGICCTEAIERILMNSPSAYVPWAVTPSTPPYSCVSPSILLAILFTWILVVITFASDKHFGLLDVRQRWLGRNIIVTRKGEVLSAGIPTIHGTAFRHLSTVYLAEASEWCMVTHMLLFHLNTGSISFWGIYLCSVAGCDVKLGHSRLKSQ